MDKPNSSHNEQALWQMWSEKVPFNRKNLQQDQTQCGRPSASTFKAEQRKMGKSGELGGKEGREVRELGWLKKVGVRGERPGTVV